MQGILDPRALGRWGVLLPYEGRFTWHLDLYAYRRVRPVHQPEPLMEEKLRASEQRYRTLFNSIDEGFCIIEVLFNNAAVPVDYRFLEVNAAFERQTGLQNPVGKTMRQLAPAHEEHWFQIYGRVALTGQSTRFEQEAEALGRWYDVYAFRVDAAEQRRVGILFTDILPRKRMQETLEHMVGQRTASLNENIRSMEIFLYTIAHDLRAPNRAMQAYAQLLAEEYSAKLDERGRFFIERIAHAAVRNERLIHDLLEFGRLMHAEFPCRSLDPLASINAAVASLECDINATQATVQVAPEWPKVLANDAALGQIMINLLSNALKYVRPGIAPSIRVFPMLVSPSHPSAPSRVRICVQDNGIGVPPGQHERIFEPFQRGTHDNYEGTGMGLAIVRKAAERMGGTTDLESQPGLGSCFWVDLTSAKHDLPALKAGPVRLP